MPERSREYVMSSRAVHIVATNTGVGECERAELNQIDVR